MLLGKAQSLRDKGCYRFSGALEVVRRAYRGSPFELTGPWNSTLENLVSKADSQVV
jgi:hypothetical protein